MAPVAKLFPISIIVLFTEPYVFSSPKTEPPLIILFVNYVTGVRIIGDTPERAQSTLSREKFSKTRRFVSVSSGSYAFRPFPIHLN